MTAVGVGSMLIEGEHIDGVGRVTPLDIVSVPKARALLIQMAQTHQRITYGHLRGWAHLPHAPNGLGRLLGMVSVDCARRDEPSLASLVVNYNTGEVGEKFLGDPSAERALVYKYWEIPEDPK